MVTLGISLYPEQESLKEMEAYIELASRYGFTKIFSSMFSVPGSPEEVRVYFQTLCEMAHEKNMEVCIDANSTMFEKYGASADDLRVFKEIGIDEIRMDMCFGDKQDQILVDNKEGIKIQFSAFMVDVVLPVIQALEDPAKVTMCHNFYPQRYTGVSRSDFRRINAIWEQMGTRIAAFITSNDPDAHGPWPVKDGLPTLERHRYQPVDLQVRDLIAQGVDTIYFGNAFAPEEELKQAQKAIQLMELKQNKETSALEMMARKLMPNLGNKKIILHPDKIEGCNKVEQEILYGFHQHCDFGDSNEYMLRSRVTRMLYGKQSIPARPCDKRVFTKGDVLIVNDHLRHYRGELQICRGEMENDGQRNLVAHLNEEEYSMVDLIVPGVYFGFCE